MTLPSGWPRRVGVLGAGAVGSLVGGLLADAGIPVVLVGRGEHAARIARDGLRLSGARGDRYLRVHATTDAASLAGSDLVIVAVKSQDTEAAARDLQPHLGADAVVLSLQNGVRNPQRLTSVVGSGRVLGGVAALGATFLSAGEVDFTMDGFLEVGEPAGGESARAAAVAALLARAVPTSVTANVPGALWAKVVINTDLPISAAVGMEFPAGFQERQVHALARAAAEEALTVITDAAIPLGGTRLEGAMRGKLVMLQQEHDALLTTLANRKGPPFKPSSLQGILRGRPSEAEHINGEIVRLAAGMGRAAPVNAALCAVARDQVAAGGRFLMPNELWDAVGGSAARG